eukprot:13520450-Ditylum_brightwellii.AAC.1
MDSHRFSPSLVCGSMGYYGWSLRDMAQSPRMVLDCGDGSAGGLTAYCGVLAVVLLIYLLRRTGTDYLGPAP